MWIDERQITLYIELNSQFDSCFLNGLSPKTIVFMAVLAVSWCASDVLVTPEHLNPVTTGDHTGGASDAWPCATECPDHLAAVRPRIITYIFNKSRFINWIIVFMTHIVVLNMQYL